MAKQEHVVVLGAGVTGLTSAVFLAEAGYKVTVIAAHVPGDSSIEYTSPWAGAHWRTHATPAQPMLCDWDLQTYHYWVEMLRREGEGADAELPRSGLKMYTSYHYWDGEVEEQLWWAPYVRDFTQIFPVGNPIFAINARKPGDAPNVYWGVSYRSVAINVPQYLLYLQKRARASGAVVCQARLPSDRRFAAALAAAESISAEIGRGKVDCFVNATGLGAAKLCGDDTMYPIRGQTVLVKGEADAIRTRSGRDYIAYCIPRPGSGTTILGGTRQVGSWEEAADEATTQQILEGCASIVPELRTAADGGFEVVSAQCGLRPARGGGPRMETEVVGARRVVHAYGHAGAGYQNSVGCARTVLTLVEESLGSSDGWIASSKL